MSSTYRVTCIGDCEGDMDVDRIEVDADSEGEAKREALKRCRSRNPQSRGWYVETIELIRWAPTWETSRDGQKARKVRPAGYCRICRGPHVYKHGRP